METVVMGQPQMSARMPASQTISSSVEELA